MIAQQYQTLCHQSMIGNNIRPIVLNDCNCLAHIEAEITLNPWSEKMFSDSLSAGHSGWVMFATSKANNKDKKTIGYCLFQLIKPEAELLLIGIHPDWQQQGNGAHLLKHTSRFLAENGIETLFLEVRPSNLAALALYTKLHFNQTGSRAGYYPTHDNSKPREDALILRCNLIDVFKNET